MKDNFLGNSASSVDSVPRWLLVWRPFRWRVSTRLLATPENPPGYLKKVSLSGSVSSPYQLRPTLFLQFTCTLFVRSNFTVSDNGSTDHPWPRNPGAGYSPVAHRPNNKNQPMSVCGVRFGLCAAARVRSLAAFHFFPLFSPLPLHLSLFSVIIFGCSAFFCSEVFYVLALLGSYFSLPSLAHRRALGLGFLALRACASLRSASLARSCSPSWSASPRSRLASFAVLLGPGCSRPCCSLARVRPLQPLARPGGVS